MGDRLGRAADDSRTPVLLLLAASIFAVAALIHFQRQSGIWFDAWYFLLYRDSWSLHTLLTPFNAHLMPVTTIAFNINRALFGPGAPGLLTAFSIAAQLGVVWAAFFYLRRRVGDWSAAACCLLLMFFGSGAEVLAWNFNIGWMVALAAGIAAVNVFERPDSVGSRLVASALLILSLAGNDSGLVFVAAVLLCAGFAEHRRRALAVALPPLVLWVVWYFATGGGGRKILPKSWPSWDANAIEATFSALIGSFNAVNAWGAPLAVLAIAVMLWLLAQRERITAELLCALALPIGFLATITIARGGIYDAAASRYQYTMFLLLALAGGELLRGRRLTTVGARLGLAAVLCVFLAGNLVAMSQGAAFFRSGYESNRIYMTALLEVGPAVASTTRFDNIDPATTPAMNKDVYNWLVERGGRRNSWSAEQLAEQPAATRAAVADTVRQMRAAAPGADSPSK